MQIILIGGFKCTIKSSGFNLYLTKDNKSLKIKVFCYRIIDRYAKQKNKTLF